MHNGGIVGEEVNQGLTRRDLLRRGAVLGGAVIWTTPVVQTLGMGRAFAQTASPIEGGKDVSYAVISWECDGATLKVKWEPGGVLHSGRSSRLWKHRGFLRQFGPPGLAVQIDPSNSACILVDVPAEAALSVPGSSPT
jgi:hypothetical protein